MSIFIKRTNDLKIFCSKHSRIKCIASTCDCILLLFTAVVKVHYYAETCFFLKPCETLCESSLLEVPCK